MGHTPGPWRTEGADHFGDHTIDQEGGSLAIAAVVSNLREEDEVSANACLIAAAPDLLEAAKALTSALEGYEWQSDMPSSEFHALLNAAMDAINKAEGVT